MKYTPEEMRDAAITAATVEVADQFYGSEMDAIADMLRCAADEFERLERDMKYEYAVRYKNGELSCLRHTEPFKDEDVAAADCICVRRAVGEWEEVTSEGRTT